LPLSIALSFRRIHPGGFYACLKTPLSKRAEEEARQTILLRKAWKDTGKVHRCRKIHDDLLNQGETCRPKRVARQRPHLRNPAETRRRLRRPAFSRLKAPMPLKAARSGALEGALRALSPDILDHATGYDLVTPH
jgi:hypothetical protein